MAIGDKKPVVMESDRGIPNGVATLGTDGKLADAQIPELDKLGAAPSGFGLGVACVKPEDSDWNNAIKNGFYTALKNSPNGGWWHGWVENYANVDITQHAFYVDTASKMITEVQRSSVDGGATWSEWEYINPRMILGVEYRTTERWQGKPVYVQMVDFGALPNNTSKVLTLEDTTIRIFEVSGISSFGVTLGGYEAEHGSTLWGRTYTIKIKTGDDQSAYTATVTIKYTKTSG